MKTIIETDRLVLRTWVQEDTESYFQINQDLEVLEFLPGPLTKSQVSDFIAYSNEHYNKHGYTFFAACLKETAELIGFVGLHYVTFESHFTPAVEIGWRLKSQVWGNGYATEAAGASLDYGFKKCGIQEIVSFTVTANVRSTHVMEKIGLKRDIRGDFNHPETGHPLSRHVLYRSNIVNNDTR